MNIIKFFEALPNDCLLILSLLVVIFLLTEQAWMICDALDNF